MRFVPMIKVFSYSFIDLYTYNVLSWTGYFPNPISRAHADKEEYPLNLKPFKPIQRQLGT